MANTVVSFAGWFPSEPIFDGNFPAIAAFIAPILTLLIAPKQFDIFHFKVVHVTNSYSAKLIYLSRSKNPEGKFEIFSSFLLFPS
jgi:hypothetical protein